MAVNFLDGSVKAPSTCRIAIQDIDAESGTGRSLATGDAFRDYISTKFKVELEWNILTWKEAAAILALVKDGGFFDVTIPNPKTGELVTKTFYASDREVYAEPGDYARERYSRLAFNLIEQ